jgi:thiamine-phosphate pyrophosphorylase
MLISDGTGASVGILLQVARQACRAGLPLAVQLREKSLPGGELLRQARELVEGLRAADGEAPVVVNGRPDVALAAGAAGVHLPVRGLPVQRVRDAFSGRLKVGASTHSVEEVRRAVVAGADYVLFGPVFATPSKAGMGEPHGLEGLAKAGAAAGPVPLLAVGGITPRRAGSCRKAGAWGVAVIRALLHAADPAEAMRGLGGTME